MVTEDWYVRAGVLTMFAESFEQARARWTLRDVRQMDGRQIEQVFRMMVPELVRPLIGSCCQCPLFLLCSRVWPHVVLRIRPVIIIGLEPATPALRLGGVSPF